MYNPLHVSLHIINKYSSTTALKLTIRWNEHASGLLGYMQFRASASSWHTFIATSLYPHPWDAITPRQRLLPVSSISLITIISVSKRRKCQFQSIANHRAHKCVIIRPDQRATYRPRKPACTRPAVALVRVRLARFDTCWNWSWSGQYHFRSVNFGNKTCPVQKARRTRWINTVLQFSTSIGNQTQRDAVDMYSF